jgi:hypothetical protein
MRCRSARKLVFEFIDGLTDDARRLELERHLSECTECEKLASQLTRSLDLLHRAPLETPQENFGWKVRLKLNQERNAVQERGLPTGALFRSWNRRYAAAAGAAFVAVVAAGLLAFDSGLNPFGPSGRPSATVERGAAALANDHPAGAAEAGSGPERKIADAAGGDRERSQSAPQPFVPDGSSLSRPVSVGGGANQGKSDVAGVIDETVRPVELDLDSIIKTELQVLPPEARIRYLEGRLRLLQRHLEECKSVKKGD